MKTTMIKYISLFIFLTSVFILAYSPACFAFSDNENVYYLDSNKENTIEIWTEDQPWWNSDWGQRQQITIFGSVRELSDYQTKIELNSENVGKKWSWSNKGADIRFVDDMNRKLNFYIESWSDIKKTAKIWVKVPSIPIGGTTIYMYYKNYGAISESNGRNTFVFFDDFDRYKNWEHFAIDTDSENVIGYTIYDTIKPASKPYALNTTFGLAETSGTITEGAQSPAINLAQTNDELILDMKYKTSGTIWENNKKNVSLKISNFPIASLDTVNKWHAFNSTIKYIPNSNNRWINASSTPFTALEQTYYYLRLNIDGVSNTLANVNLDDIRVRKYAEQEPVVEISNWYGSSEKTVIVLDDISNLGMLFDIGEKFEKMEQKKLEIEAIQQEEKELEELKALEEEERKRRQGFQIQETVPNTSTQLYLIKGQTLNYVIGGNIRESMTIGGNIRTPMVIGGTGASAPVSAPAQKAIDTSRQANQGSKAAKDVGTSASTSAKAHVANAFSLLRSAAKAALSNDLSTAIKAVDNAAKAIARAQHEVKITKTAVEIENRFTDISDQATGIASYHIARQISSGGYSQSFTQQQIQSAVSRAITRSTSGQVTEIILEKFIETEIDEKMMISGKEVLKITVKTAEEELNTVTPQKISDDITDSASSQLFLDMDHCPFGCSKPEVVSDKSISEIDDSNLLMRIEEQDDGLRAIKISSIQGGETTYIPIIIDKYTVEGEKEILVIKIGTIAEDDHGLTVKKIEINISDIGKITEVELDDIPAVNIDEPMPIVDDTPDNDYTPIEPSYTMTKYDGDILRQAWADNQKFRGAYAKFGFSEFTDKTLNSYSDYKSQKEQAINDGMVILEEGVSPNGEPYFMAGIAHGQKTEMLKISTGFGEGNIPEINTGLKYNVNHAGSTTVNLNDLVSADADNYEFDVSGANDKLINAEIVGDNLVINPINPDKTYGTDYINVWVTDTTTGKTALNKIFITKGESKIIENPEDAFDATVNGEKADKIVVHFENFDIELGDQLYIGDYRVKSADDIPIWGPQNNEIYVDKDGYTTPFTPESDTVIVEKKGSGSSTFNIGSVTNIGKPEGAGENFALLIAGTGEELGNTAEQNQIAEVLVTDGGFNEDNVVVASKCYKKDFDNAVTNLYNDVSDVINNGENVNKVVLEFRNHGQLESKSGHIPWTETATKEADKGIIGLCTRQNGCTGMPPDPSTSSNDIKITSGQMASIANNLVAKGVKEVIINIVSCHSGGIGEFIYKDLSTEAKKKVTIVASVPGPDVDYSTHMRRTSEGISGANGNIQTFDEEDGPVYVVHSPNPDATFYADSNFIAEEPLADSNKTYTSGSLQVHPRP